MAAEDVVDGMFLSKRRDLTLVTGLFLSKRRDLTLVTGDPRDRLLTLVTGS